MVLNLEEDNVGVALLGNANKIKDGDVVIYRCYRTEMELQMMPQGAGLGGQQTPRPKDSCPALGADHSAAVSNAMAMAGTARIRGSSPPPTVAREGQ